MEKLKTIKQAFEEKGLEVWTAFEAGNVKGQHFALVLMVGLLAAVPAFATSGGADPWKNFADLIIDWATNNLGKLLALLAVIIGAIMSLATHSFKPLAYSVIIAVFIGGIVGIAKLFFDAGGTAFGTSW